MANGDFCAGQSGAPSAPSAGRPLRQPGQNRCKYLNSIILGSKNRKFRQGSSPPRAFPPPQSLPNSLAAPPIVFTVQKKQMSQGASSCPHCARPLPESGLAGVCPFCHQPLTAVPHAPLLVLNADKTNWGLFFVISLIPPVCSFILTACEAIFFTILFTFVSSLWSGIVCSRKIAARLQVTGRQRRWLAMLVQLCMLAVTFSLCFVGCSLAGGTLIVHRSPP